MAKIKSLQIFLDWRLNKCPKCGFILDMIKHHDQWVTSLNKYGFQILVPVEIMVLLLHWRKVHWVLIAGKWEGRFIVQKKIKRNRSKTCKLNVENIEKKCFMLRVDLRWLFKHEKRVFFFFSITDFVEQSSNQMMWCDVQQLKESIWLCSLPICGWAPQPNNHAHLFYKLVGKCPYYSRHLFH